MAILERVWSEADLISWGSIELLDAHPRHTHREDAQALAWRVSDKERCALAHALTGHADQADDACMHLGSGSSASAHSA